MVELDKISRVHLLYSADWFAVIPSYKIASSTKFSSLSTTESSTVFSRFDEDHIAKVYQQISSVSRALDYRAGGCGINSPGLNKYSGSQNN